MVQTHRLVAIFAAGVADYSRLMERDEVETHQFYTSHLRELLTPKIREHQGHIIKSTGDRMLAEFPSVVDAVVCAVAVQRGMGARNSTIEEDRRLEFRIGINFGDVIVEPGDIFGDAVNIAARLEGLTKPNGICISQAVHEQIVGKLSYKFDDLGMQWVKNISRPLHAYALKPEAIAELIIHIETPIRSRLDTNISSLEPTPRRAPRLSIVVLPFTNLINDREQQYIADALTDDVTTDLSRINDMMVISRNTAFSYKDKPVSSRQIGHDLNVKYLLSGSIHRAGSRFHVNAQLIDAEKDVHIWAERFDYNGSDLIALQDEITSRIAVALNLNLILTEADRPSEQPDAFDYILRGRAALNRGSNQNSFSEAIGYLERALSLDPTSADGRIFLAHALVARVLEQVSPSAAADLQRAEQLISEAMTSSSRKSLLHLWRGQLLRAQRRYEWAIPEYKMALEFDRNSVLALAALGMCGLFAGALEEVIPAQERAIRLSPADPYIASWLWRIGMVHLLQSRTDEAISWLERACSINSQLPGPRAWLVSAYALRGDLARAAQELIRARALSGDNRYDSIEAHPMAQPFVSPSVQLLAERTLFAGLRKAGVPQN